MALKLCARRTATSMDWYTCMRTMRLVAWVYGSGRISAVPHSPMSRSAQLP